MLGLETRLVLHSEVKNVVFIYMHVYTCVSIDVGKNPHVSADYLPMCYSRVEMIQF